MAKAISVSVDLVQDQIFVLATLLPAPISIRIFLISTSDSGESSRPTVCILSGALIWYLTKWCAILMSILCCSIEHVAC